MKNIEVLVSTMNREVEDKSLAKQMNLATNALIINQCDNIGYSETQYGENKVKQFSFNEKGVGLSRNNALMRSQADICVMADDDMVYVDGYEKIILDAYKQYPEADFIVFNVRVHYKDRIEERVTKNGPVSFLNCLKYGTVTFTFKRQNIFKKNMSFSLLFGGGAKYSSGEDTIFIWTALKKKMKVYSIKTVIADVYNYDSSWFEGYTEKYFFDKGALFKALEPNLYPLLNLQFAIRKRKKFGSNKSIIEILKIMNKGSKDME